MIMQKLLFSYMKLERNHILKLIVILLFISLYIEFYFNKDSIQESLGLSFIKKSNKQLVKPETEEEKLKRLILLKKQYVRNDLKKFVLLSINPEIENDFYLFHIPLVCLAWKRINFEPIVIFIYSKKRPMNAQVSKVTLDYFHNFNITVIELETRCNFELMTSMVSRLFGGILPDSLVKDEDYIITSDADLYPIDYLYYRIENVTSIKSWNAFCCGVFEYNNKTIRFHVMGHIGMTKKVWRDLLELKNNQKNKW